MPAVTERNRPAGMGLPRIRPQTRVEHAQRSVPECSLRRATVFLMSQGLMEAVGELLMSVSLRCRIISLAIAFAAGPLTAAWPYEQSLSPVDVASGTNGLAFGKSVAADVRADGRIRALYVGAPNATVTASGTDHPGAGKVYVLTPIGGWHVVATLTAPAPQDGAHFGAAVAAHEGVVAVGAPDYDYPGGHVDSGAMHVFQDTTRDAPGDALPVLQSYAPGYRVSQQDGTHFATSVAVGGSTLANGAWIASGTPDEYDGDGCVRIDYHGGSTHTYGGAACGTGGSGGKLGASLALYSASQTFYVLVAGAPAMAQGAQSLAGEAYVYVPIDGTITKLDTLKAQNPGFLDAFGGSVALDATHIYVGGAGRVKSGVGRTGSVSVFVPTGIIGYGFSAEVFPGGGAAGDLCGASLSARHEADGMVAMGCPGWDGLVDNEGGVIVLQEFDFMGTPVWSQDRLGMSDVPHGADDLGRDVALVGDRVYAGAPNHDDAVGINNGIVRVFAPDRIFQDGFD